ncbi:ceramide kinase [Apis cerana cerana]|uniref:Ceramide kinase n=1 Tax=Apis cerana cerana TaxID=94128 RepID=A0A2A3ENB6_APICC|nr:ceramide kinase [Apis cerana cerana]
MYKQSGLVLKNSLERWVTTSRPCPWVFCGRVEAATRWTLPMTDVLAVRYGDDWIHGINFKEKQLTTSPTSPTVCPTNFILHYAVHGPKNKWSHHSVTMSHTDPRQVASWVKTIRNYLMGKI